MPWSATRIRFSLQTMHGLDWTLFLSHVKGVEYEVGSGRSRLSWEKHASGYCLKSATDPGDIGSVTLTAKVTDSKMRMPRKPDTVQQTWIDAIPCSVFVIFETMANLTLWPIVRYRSLSKNLYHVHNSHGNLKFHVHSPTVVVNLQNESEQVCYFD